MKDNLRRLATFALRLLDSTWAMTLVTLAFCVAVWWWLDLPVYADWPRSDCP